MKTAFERAYQETVKTMTIAQEYSEERQRQIREENKGEKKMRTQEETLALLEQLIMRLEQLEDRWESAIESLESKEKGGEDGRN